MRTQSLLLDINVWLDYCFPGRAGHESAFRLVDSAIDADCRLLIAASSLSDFFYIVNQVAKAEAKEGTDRKPLSPNSKNREGSQAAASCTAAACIEVAWAFVEHVLDIAFVVGSDQSDAWIALKHRGIHNDFEDNLVVAAAIRSKADCLITNDAVLLQHASVAALSSEDWLALHAS